MSRPGSEKVSFEGPAGLLEGLWLPAGSERADRLVVLCHPHPLHGGSMETKLVARTARRLAESGFQTLRFNFRGVGRSAGAWDQGKGERGDLAAAVDYAVSRSGRATLAVFGFSFGAAMALEVGAGDSRVAALVAVAPPVGWFAPGSIEDTAKPLLVVGAGRDDIVDPGELEAWVGRLPGAVRFRMIDPAGHLFQNEADEVADLTVEFLDGAMKS